ncbi:MAG: hypothetical protein JST04_05610 [Bdellovibrionales bacterium]|nr:hypothetical protein [Bdellovibrionales bacterium]
MRNRLLPLIFLSLLSTPVGASGYDRGSCIGLTEKYYDKEAVKLLMEQGNRREALREMLFSPRNFLRQMGVAPEEMSIVISLDRRYTSPAIDLKVYIPNSAEPVVDLSLLDAGFSYISDERSVQSGSIKSITSEKKGLASVVYLFAARYLYKTRGERLASDILSMGPLNTLSDDARKVWSRFTEMGLTRTRCPDRGECYYYFTREALESPDLDAFDHFEFKESF